MEPMFNDLFVLLNLSLDALDGDIDGRVGVGRSCRDRVIHVIAPDVASRDRVLPLGRKVPFNVNSSLEVSFQPSCFLVRILLQGFSRLEVLETELNEHCGFSFSEAHVQRLSVALCRRVSEPILNKGWGRRPVSIFGS